jgi:hypothetical protein
MKGNRCPREDQQSAVAEQRRDPGGLRMGAAGRVVHAAGTVMVDRIAGDPQRGHHAQRRHGC